jgi:hypothetical protein
VVLCVFRIKLLYNSPWRNQVNTTKLIRQKSHYKSTYTVVDCCGKVLPVILHAVIWWCNIYRLPISTCCQQGQQELLTAGSINTPAMAFLCAVLRSGDSFSNSGRCSENGISLRTCKYMTQGLQYKNNLFL